MPGIGYGEAFGVRKPGLHEGASFDEPWSAFGAEHVEHRLRDALGLGGAEGPLLHGGQLGLEEQVRLVERFVEGAGDGALQGAAVAVTTHVAQEAVDGSGDVARR